MTLRVILFLTLMVDLQYILFLDFQKFFISSSSSRCDRAFFLLLFLKNRIPQKKQTKKTTVIGWTLKFVYFFLKQSNWLFQLVWTAAFFIQNSEDIHRSRKHYIRRNKNKVDCNETGCTITAHLFLSELQCTTLF